jgi:hypothetical protein
MNWIVASVRACVAGATAPLLMVESIPDVRRMASLTSRRRQLWVATLLMVFGLGAWLYADRTAIAAGERSLRVTVGAVGAFTSLFAVFAYPALRAVQVARSTTARPLPRSVPLFRSGMDAPAIMLFAAAVVGVLLSPNDFGYRIKGGGIIVSALTLYFLGQPRAPRTFLAFISAAAVTLFAQWEDPWQRTIGVASQLVVAAIGFVWCARLLTRADPAA